MRVRERVRERGRERGRERKKRRNLASVDDFRGSEIHHPRVREIVSLNDLVLGEESENREDRSLDSAANANRWKKESYPWRARRLQNDERRNDIE